MRMFNTSLEKFQIQCDSKVLFFTPRTSTVVPDHLVEHVYAQTKDMGVFPMRTEWTPEETKAIEILLRTDEFIPFEEPTELMRLRFPRNTHTSP